MDIKKYLQEILEPAPKLAIMGVGSVLKADDAAGMALIEMLERHLPASDQLLLIAASTAPENFTGVIKDFAPERMLVVDAAHIGGKPGEIRLLEPEEIGGMTFSTHMLPLPVMINYLRQELYYPVDFIGIQPRSTETGFSVSQEVYQSVEKLANDLIKIIKEKY